MDKLKQVIHQVSTTKTVKENEQAVNQVVQDLARHSSKKLQLEFPNFNVPRLCYRDGDDVRRIWTIGAKTPWMRDALQAAPAAAGFPAA